MTRPPGGAHNGARNAGPFVILEILMRPSQTPLRTIVVSLVQVLLATALLLPLVGLIHLIVVGLMHHVAPVGALLSTALALAALLAALRR